MGPQPDELPPDPLRLDELTEADLASVGLTADELTPELVAALTDTRRMLLAAAPGPPPADVVRRWHAALAQLPPPEPATPADRRLNTGSSTASSPWRRRLACRPGMALAAAACVLLVAGLGLVADWAATWRTESTAGSRPAALGGFEVGPAAGGRALYGADAARGGPGSGPLADPARRAGCLAHVGAGSGTVLGSRQVSWSGRPGVLLALATPEPGRLRLLVVTPDCGPTSGELLADLPTSGR